MNKISDVAVNDQVYVISRKERGAVSRVNPGSICVALVGGVVEVYEGDFDKRAAASWLD